MAAGSPAKIESILEFSSHLQEILSKPLPSHKATFAELSNYVAAFPIPQSEISQLHRTRIKTCAASLWNSCNKYNGSSGNDVPAEKDVSRVRVLAFLLLESVVKRNLPGKSSDPIIVSPPHAKHFRTGCDAARYCLRADQPEDAVKIAELLAKRYGDILNQDGPGTTLAASHNELLAEFICLRIAIDWKRGRLDLAAHQNLKFNSLIKKPALHQLSLATIEKWLDLVYEIGTEELSQCHYRNASTWLNFGKEFFEVAQDSSCHTELGDVRFNILHAYARSLLGGEDAEAGIEALKTIAILKKDYRDKLPVMLLQLELLSKDSEASPDAFFVEIMSIVRSVHLIDSNHKLIVFYIHKLCELSCEYALRILQQYVTLRLVHQTNNQWTERAIVTFLWMLTTRQGLERDRKAETLRSFLDSISSAWKNQLSVEAAHAGLVLLWRQIDELATQAPDQGVLWCMFGLHQLFGQASEEHIGKIERKMISCYHLLSEYESARIALSEMSSKRRAHPLSRYLAYCTCIKLGDEQEAQAALSAIVSQPNRDSKLLFACVGETMRYGSKLQSARLLQRLLDKYSNNAPPEIDIPALLRCTTRLLLSVADEPQVDRDETLRRLCHVLKAAVSYSTLELNSGSGSTAMLSYEDCRWFEQHSFNAAVKHLKEWPSKHIIDILQYSSQISYPTLDAAKNTELGQRKKKHELTVAFLQVVLYASEARSFEQSLTFEDLPRTSFSSRAKPTTDKVQHTLYKNVFDRYWQITQACETRKELFTQHETEELRARLCTVLPLGFEALLYMNGKLDTQESEFTRFDDLSLVLIVDTAIKIEAPPKVYALLADLVLCAATHQRPQSDRQPVENGSQESGVIPLTSATKLLSKIVQAVRNLQVYDLNQAARWIRCITQLIIDSINAHNDTKLFEAATPFNAATSVTDDLLKSIIDQAILLAKSAAETTAASDQYTRPADRDEDVDMLNNKTETSNQVQKQIVYPPEELEYLATVLFNMAVDFYVAGNEDQARWYAGKAIDIADVLALPSAGNESRGTLAKLLRQKTGTLGWSL